MSEIPNDSNDTIIVIKGQNAQHMSSAFKAIGSPKFVIALQALESVMDKMIQASGLGDVLKAPFEIMVGGFTSEFADNVKSFSDALLTDENKELFNALGEAAGELSGVALDGLKIALTEAKPLIEGLTTAIRAFNEWVKDVSEYVEENANGGSHATSQALIQRQRAVQGTVYERMVARGASSEQVNLKGRVDAAGMAAMDGEGTWEEFYRLEDEYKQRYG